VIVDFADGSTFVVPEHWTLPAGQTPSHCRSCGAHVIWLVSRNGKASPFNHDGINHFATCAQADRWRKRP